MILLSRSCRRLAGRLGAKSLVTVLLALSGHASAQSTAVVLEIEGAIGVAQAEYIASGLEHARETGADIVVIKLDTPGGLVSSTEDIVQDILGSAVPVATYVWPQGAHAASAGTYILMASHVAAMAPTTRIGAATPVSLTGDDATPDAPGDADEGGEDESESEAADDRTLPGTAMERKVLNDAVAHIRGLAERYGRNAEWAERAVTKAITATAAEALELGVIEFVAEDETDLFRQMNGHEVTVLSVARTLDMEAVTVDAYEPDWRTRFLAVISNPEIVLILGMIGLYGLMYEGWNPGAIVPGVVGVICLLIAAYALQILPVNYAGLALILLGLALMVAEAFAPSFGALGIGGIAAFSFGAIMMFDSGIPGFGISIAFVVTFAALFALLVIWLIGYVLKLRRRGAVSGRESIVGGIGVALADFDGDGKIWLEGESWIAHSHVPIRKDQEVVVTRMDGLTLEIEPAPQAADDTLSSQST